MKWIARIHGTLSAIIARYKAEKRRAYLLKRWEIKDELPMQ